MMRQYRRIKQDHPDAILFFRLGDFYEMFERDAKEASALLGLTLTARAGVPMCGIPYHAAHTYVARLLAAGKKIAICEQLALPTGGKKLADRDVIEIVTPGTVVDEDYLDERRNNYLLAVAKYRSSMSLSYVDLSTGEFAVTDFPWSERLERLAKELGRLRPREIIVQESLLEEDGPAGDALRDVPGAVINRYPDWTFDLAASSEMLKKQLGTASLKGFGLDDDTPAIYASGIILDYLSDTAKSLLPHIRSVNYYHDSEYLGLDEATQRNLEILHNLQDGGGRYTLVETLDHTKTAMGARRLRRWLLRPLRDGSAIESRQLRVTSFYRNQVLLSSVRDLLSGILDLERLCARVALDRAHAKDLLAVRGSLERALSLDALGAEQIGLFAGREEERSTIRKTKELLDSSIDEDPSVLLTEGRLIKTGYNSELDDLKAMRDNSKAILDAYLEEERKATGINTLRIRYNRIIGYFFEVTKSYLSMIPSHFIRRQSLVGAERFTTDRMIDLETELNSAGERIVDLERDLFLQVRESVKARIEQLLAIANGIAELDCVQSLAQAATVHGWVCPTVEEGSRLVIVGGRHPVVEANLPSGDFVPNDTNLDSSGASFALITGPNMAGKSTYLRQVALIVLMAQIGSFVPAQEATIGLVDRIFCRVGAQDNLARGESTFLVEMNETANILRSATPQSLIIMDEVGRGTGTNDGLSIAWAVCEYLLSVVGAKTLFATHYHELTAIDHPKLVNLSMQVLERADDIVFLKRVQPGPSENSYGIHVARLAGLPDAVLRRAREILRSITESSGKPAPPPPSRQKAEQAALFLPEELVRDAIQALRIEETTPVEALNLIARWKKELGPGE
ncbi:MAG TPA: DNA mismatch repair protein MutS [Spirochaetia bacterium]|nr:DNA mismatch repair protein MutS [Spirochaetia bacterium]